MPALPGRRRSPLPGAAPIAAADAWRLRDVSWRTVWRRQDHASLLLTLLVAVAVVVIYVAVGPREEQFFLYDATLSYPPSGEHGFDPTVPSVVAILAPLVMWLGTLVVGEFIYSKREHHSVTDAVAVALYFILDAVGSLAVTLLVTQATKVSVARLRPDFLARCQPQNAPSTIELEYGQDTAAMYPCTSPDSSAVQDGRQSFPSGHAAYSFNLTAYASCYLIWCWHMRRAWAPRRMSPRAEFLADLGNVAAKVWMLLMLALAWGISMSRMVDNQHHAVDVVAGMVLGVLIALLFITRSVPRYARVLSEPPCAAPGAPPPPPAPLYMTDP